MKVFLFKKSVGSYHPGAKRVMLSACEPLGFYALYPLINTLRKDPRCRTIAVVAESIAEELFEKRFARERLKPKFILLKNPKLSKDTKPRAAWIDVLKDRGERIFEVVITTVDVYTHPKLSLLYQAKRSFGVNKLFIIHYSWTSIGSRKSIVKKGKTEKEIMGQVDGIFCNDKLAKLIILHYLPDFSPDKIFITSTPIIDELEQDKAKQYYEMGRKKLKLEEDDIVVLYLRDTNEDYKHIKAIDRQIDKKTLVKTVWAMAELAKQQPEKNFVLLIRSHPRDPNKKKFPSLPPNKKLPKNLRIILTKENISINEVTYSADVIASIASTENHLAPLRGKFGIFLGYRTSNPNLGLGQNVLKKIYGQKMLKLVKKEKNIFIVSSPKEFVALLKKCYRWDKSDLTPKNNGRKRSVQEILDIALAN